MHIDGTRRHRAIGYWHDNVFELLLAAYKIDDDVVANMRDWKHSGLTATIPVASLRAASPCSPRVHAFRVQPLEGAAVARSASREAVARARGRPARLRPLLR